jgi:hypothetical protein
MRKKLMTRTVKIDDEIHHKIRMLSVRERMPMQDFIERLLKHALLLKPWETWRADDEIKRFDIARTV